MKNMSKFLMVLGLALLPVGCVMEDERLLQEGEEPLLEEELLLEDAGEQTSAVSPEASVEHATCGQAGPNRTNRITTNAAYPNAANQRSGSSTGCAINGVLQPTDDALYHCWTRAGNYTWTYLKNMRTGVHGWVRDDLLRDNGSPNACW